MTKYKQYFKRMLENEKELFEEFQKIHDKYALDEDKHQEEFNEIGKKVLKVAREWEGKLCHQTEGGNFAKFSGNLAEKFQNELRKQYPMIDYVGIIIKKKPSFFVKKITLS